MLVTVGRMLSRPCVRTGPMTSRLPGEHLIPTLKLERPLPTLLGEHLIPTLKLERPLPTLLKHRMIPWFALKHMIRSRDKAKTEMIDTHDQKLNDQLMI